MRELSGTDFREYRVFPGKAAGLSGVPAVPVQHRLCEPTGHQPQLLRGRKPAGAEKRLRAVLLQAHHEQQDRPRGH